MNLNFYTDFYVTRKSSKPPQVFITLSELGFCGKGTDAL